MEQQQKQLLNKTVHYFCLFVDFTFGVCRTFCISVFPRNSLCPFFLFILNPLSFFGRNIHELRFWVVNEKRSFGDLW